MSQRPTRLILDPSDPSDLPPNAILIAVVPGATKLEETLVAEHDMRTQLRMWNRPTESGAISTPEERASLRGRLKRHGRGLREMIRAWREG